MGTGKRIILALLLLALAAFSFFYLKKYCSSPEVHAHTIREMDEKKQDVKELAAASTAASVTITLLPGDVATPVAEKLADLSQYLLIILCAIYLEKYLVTVLGFVCFGILLPVSLLLLAISLFIDVKRLPLLALRLVAISMALYFVIPASVWVTDRIEETYAATIDPAFQAGEGIEEEKEGQQEDAAAEENAAPEKKSVSEEAEEDASLWDKLKSLPSAITETANEAVANATQVTEEKMKEIETLLNRFMESVAVMIITSCVIPVLVLFFFIFIIKMVFGAGVPAVVVVSGEEGRRPDRRIGARSRQNDQGL